MSSRDGGVWILALTLEEGMVTRQCVCEDTLLSGSLVLSLPVEAPLAISCH